MRSSKRYSMLLATLTVVVLFATSCKNKCYYCVERDDQNVIIDTVNTLCEDSPQYNANYLNSWKIACSMGGGETISKEE